MRNSYLAVPALLAALNTGCYENFGDTEKIATINGSTLFDSDLAADDSENLHVAARSSASLWHFKSTDDGATWTNQKIDTGDRPQYPIKPECRMHTDGYSGDLLVAYTEDNGSGGGRVAFAKSTDEGATWISHTSLRSGNAAKADLLITSRGTFTGNAIVVVWREFNGDTWEIRARHSTDGGSSWTASVQASYGRGERALGLGYTPDLSRLVLLYALQPSSNRYQTEVRSKYSTDHGETWSGYYQIADYSKCYDILGGDLRQNGDDLVAVWATNYHLRTSSSTNGSSWGAPEAISSGWNNRENLRMVFPEGLPAVLSYETNEDIYYRENDGGSWVASRRLNNYVDSAHGYGGMIEVNGRLHAVWLDDRWNGYGDPELAWADAAPTPESDEFSVSFSQSTTFPFTSRGADVGFDVVAGNWSGDADSKDVWVEAVGDDGLERTIFTQLNQALEDEEEVTLPVSLRVPGGTPREGYTVTAYIGANRIGAYRDSDSFYVIVD